MPKKTWRMPKENHVPNTTQIRANVREQMNRKLEIIDETREKK